MTDLTIEEADRRASGMKVMKEYFLANVSKADALGHAANRVSFRFESTDDPLRVSMSQVEYGLDALSSATFFLGAAVNSLLALRLLTFGEIVDVDGVMKMDAHITVNGTAGLIRQTVECAARALWLVSPKSAEDLNLRGFAAVWANAEEACRFAKAIGSPEADEKEKFFQELLDAGLSKGWMNEGARKPKPTYPLSDATGILAGVTFDAGPLSPAVHLLGTNVNNGEWVYRWSSGMAHGHAWVHSKSPEGMKDPVMELVWTKPDWMKLGLSTALAAQVIQNVLDVFSQESLY